ncbi:MAG: RNA polymerase sigma factor [Planctomycetota bacterium]|jgi:RNA polymerase sigma-70 factor (ECF subfamily)
MHSTESTILITPAAPVNEPERDRKRSDEALVEALRGGDRGAFRELMMRHKNGITSYLFRRVGDRDWAEDLAQEVFFRVFNKASTFKSEARFTTWLYRIAHNLSVDFMKRKRLEPRLGIVGTKPDSECGGFVAIDACLDPEEEAMRKEAATKVIEVVESLGAKYRDVFVLCAMQQLSYEEAAEVLGLSVKTVSSRLCRARKRFKGKIASVLDRIRA